MGAFASKDQVLNMNANVPKAMKDGSATKKSMNASQIRVKMEAFALTNLRIMLAPVLWAMQALIVRKKLKCA
jgi:hypothetical protein